MTIDAVDEMVASIWARRLAWSAAADKLKARVHRPRAAALLLGIFGAILETASATLLAGAARTVSASAGAALLALGTFVTIRFVSVGAVRAWTRARSVSEAIKAAIWSFRAKAAPYDGADAAQRLQEEVAEIEGASSDLAHHKEAVQTRKSSPPPALGPDQYVEFRLVKQRDGYYRPESAKLRRRLTLLRAVEFWLGIIATAMSAVAAVVAHGAPAAEPAQTPLGAWVAVLTTVGAAVAAHIAANRYEFLVMSYSATALRLDHLIEAWKAARAPTDPARWSEFVRACEDAISVENESWLAKWVEEKPERHLAAAVGSRPAAPHPGQPPG